MMKMKRIVIIDDNDILLRAWERIFAEHGCDCFTTIDADKAIAYAASKDVDLVITDIVMPGHDGFDVMKRIHRLKPDLPVIMTTSYVCDFAKLGFGAYPGTMHVLLKPYEDLEKVCEFVFQILKKEPDVSPLPAGGRDFQLWSL